MSKAANIQSRLNMGNPLEALKVGLQNPPFQGSPAEKAADADAVVSVLAQFKDQQIEQAVNSLNQDELDVLMKYVYKGLSVGKYSNALFKWHDAVESKVGGLGAVMRVLTDTQNTLIYN